MGISESANQRISESANRSRLMLGTTTLLLAAVAGWCISAAVKPTPTSGRAAPVTILEEQLNFGSVTEQERFPWSINLQNTTNTPITVASIANSCSCLEISPSAPFVIDAKARQMINLTLHLVPKNKAEVASPNHRFEVLFSPTIVADGRTCRPEFLLYGDVRSTIQLAQPSFDLGRHSQLSQSDIRLRTPVTQLQPLVWLEATAKSASWRANVSRNERNRQEFIVEVTPIDKLPVGPFGFDLVLEPLAEQGKLPPRTVPVSGRIVADVQPSTPQVHFGAQRTGSTVNDYLTLSSLTGKKILAVDASVEGQGLRIAKQPTEISGNPAFLVEQKITSLGDAEGKVRLQVRTEAQEKVEVVVPVGYHGIGE